MALNLTRRGFIGALLKGSLAAWWGLRPYLPDIAHAGPSPEEVYFREDRDSLYLGNQFLELALSKVRGGALVRVHNKLTGQELIGTRDKANTLWSVQSLENRFFGNWSAPLQRLTYQVTDLPDGKLLTLTWPTVGGARGLSATVQITCDRTPLTRWRIEYANTDPAFKVRSVRFPHIRPVTALRPGDCGRVYAPLQCRRAATGRRG